jgi:hypothetical protein
MLEQSKKSSKLGGIDDNHDFVVRIPYRSQLDAFKPHTLSDRLDTWNEALAFAVEHFGLANSERYSCRLCDHWVEFWFLNEKDAMFFQLSCG